MSGFILPGVIGLLLGLLLHWTQLCRPGALQIALALRICHALRSLLYFLGTSMALSALLMWLAVIDVDGIVVLPLSLGALIGGAVFGTAVALTGYTPLTAFAGLGGRQAPEALSLMGGCLAGALLLPLLDAPLSFLQALPPLSPTTLFRTTLDEPFLLGGGFLAQGCVGALMMAIALCIPSNRHGAAATVPMEPVPANTAPPPNEGDEAPEAVGPDAISGPLLLLPAPAEAPAPPQTAPEDAFIALLPGEEPLVVDTAPDAEDAGKEPCNAPADADLPDPPDSST